MRSPRRGSSLLAPRIHSEMHTMSYRNYLLSPLLTLKRWRAGDYAVATLKVLLPYLGAALVLLGAQLG
jgi:hypothetical protein